MKQLSYRCPRAQPGPSPGTILMGVGPRVRRAYRILGARQSKSVPPAPDAITWKLAVESMSAARGREAIAEGHPHWPIYWDSRKRRAR